MSLSAPETGVGVAPFVPSVKVEGRDGPGYVHYTANLDGFESPVPLYPPTHCNPDFIILQCNCVRRIVPSACMSLNCEHCAGQVGKRRAESVLRRLLGDTYYQRRKHWRKPVIFTTFTIPPRLRERFLDEKLWRKMRRKAWRILKDTFAAKYGVEASHPVGDKNPNVFHPHLNFLWIQEKGHRPFIDTALLQRKWSEALDVEVSDVYTQYSTHIRQISHWAKYVTRTFPGNHKWAGSLRWYGKYPKLRKPEHCICHDCGSRFKVIGRVSAELVDQWLEHGILMGRAPPWERDQDIQPLSRIAKGA